jgi:hypothetical protein
MYMYSWRLARPRWLVDAAATALAIAEAALVLGWADDVPGTLYTGHWINLVVAAAAAAPLRDPAAAVLDATPYSRRQRRLAPISCVLHSAALLWLACAAVQATRVPVCPGADWRWRQPGCARWRARPGRGAPTASTRGWLAAPSQPCWCCLTGLCHSGRAGPPIPGRAGRQGGRVGPFAPWPDSRL